MIDSDYVRVMARYNGWQNRSILMAASRLNDAGRQRDGGAFFGSIEATLNHLLWADRIWLSRFTDVDPPKKPSIAESVGEGGPWPDYVEARRSLDDAILVWSTDVSAEWLTQDLTWFSGAAGREVTKPVGMLVTHFFNHQTHHRGQIHALLTGTGIKPDADTDLFFLPSEAM